MAHLITLPEGYGYTLLIATVLTPALAGVQGTLVTTLRKPAGIPYPHAYATPQQVKASPAAYRFNCAQRAHANLLENLPQTVVGMLVGALVYPRLTAWLGAAWWVSRVLYVAGYVVGSGKDEAGKGKGRLLGAGFWLAQFGIMAVCAKVALGCM